MPDSNKLTKGGIRSAEADEIAGLDVTEMGVPAYHTGDVAYRRECRRLQRCGMLRS